jgi:hypothetical protein
MRFSFTCFVASMCIAILALSESGSLARDPAPSDKSAQERLEALNKLRQEKLKAAEERFNAVKAAFVADRLPDFDPYAFDLYPTSKDLKEAAYEAAKTNKDRQAALKGHLDRMNELYEHSHALFVANRKGGEAENVATTHFWQLEAKVWLLEEETKP